MGMLAMPIFEGIHFLLHLGDDSPTHSFYDHTTTHSHQILTDWNDLLNNPLDTPINPTPNYKFKNITHSLNEQANDIDWVTVQHTSNFCFAIIIASTPFLPIILPPPKV